MTKFRKVKNQKGFTLVELAIVLVIIGIILGAVIKGQELINNSKMKRIQSDLKGFEALIYTYIDRKGRLPGDCSNQGIYTYTPPLVATGIGTGTPPSNNVDPLVDYCALAATVETINTPFSDLRAAQIATYSTPNIVLAKHGFNDFFKIGSSAAIAGVQYNIIVVYGIPTWLAKAVDVAIDGVENGEAGRVRQYTTAAVGSVWPAVAQDNQVTALSYFFDKSP